jgi:hypothetical protein
MAKYYFGLIIILDENFHRHFPIHFAIAARRFTAAGDVACCLGGSQAEWRRDLNGNLYDVRQQMGASGFRWFRIFPAVPCCC